MSWADELIGLPYRDRGRASSPAEARAHGVDCLGLTMLARLVRTGERMPEAGIDAVTNLRAAVARAHELMTDPLWRYRSPEGHDPEEMDIVVMLRATDLPGPDRLQPLHVGTWLDSGGILHIQAPTGMRTRPEACGPDLGSRIIDGRDPKVRARIVGFARWRGEA